MSRPRESDGAAPVQRLGLTRRRKNLRLDLRWPIYEKLLRLVERDEGGRSESIVSTIERLIESAPIELDADAK